VSFLSRGSKKGVIFDMDGTLLSLPIDWRLVRSRLEDIAGREQFQPIFETMKDVIFQSPEMKAELFGALDDYELNAERSALFHPGSRQVVETLSRDAKLALVTMQGKKVRDRLLQRFEVAPYFQVLLSREDSLDRAEQLNIALRALSVTEAEAVFVGDRLNDLNAAAKVGVDFVFIRGPEEDDDTPARMRFQDMASFMTFLSERNDDTKN
jgi:HAD superfamily hydrolase (TIGR01509 family)